MIADEELAEHWRNLRECEKGGTKPRVYRQLLEHINMLRKQLGLEPIR